MGAAVPEELDADGGADVITADTGDEMIRCAGKSPSSETAVTEGLSPPPNGAATLVATGRGTLSETPRPAILVCELNVRGDADSESAMAVLSDERAPRDGFRGAGRNDVGFNFLSAGSAER
jgi:hypothetical protein